MSLDLGGTTLRGLGGGAGVLIEAGAMQVTVRDGTVIGFATGVRAEDTSGTGLRNVRALHSAGDGIAITGDDNTLDRSVVENSGGHGIRVHGHDNRVANVRIEGNGGAGMSLEGSGNTAVRNTSALNLGAGLVIRGGNAVVDHNRATRNGEAGLDIGGVGHIVTSNLASANTGTGLQMAGTAASRIEGNQAANNRGFGVSDDSMGSGTAGTANTYTRSLCGRANTAGASTPSGLCR